MPRRRLVTVAVLAGALLLLSPGLAHASCAPPVPMRKAIEEAPSAFVGEVVEVTNGRRWATVEVEQVWKGPALPSAVEIRAGPADPPGPLSSATSVDRTFAAGITYLFVPYRAKGSIFYDNACTRTTRLRPELERFGEAFLGATSNEPNRQAPAGATPSGARVWVAVAGGLAALSGAAWLLARRRISPE
jgi:hypothetical protein